MVKHLRILFLVLLTTLMAPQVMAFADVPAVVDNSADDVSLVLVGRTLHVRGGSGQMLQVFNVAGQPVLSVRIDVPEKQIDLSLGRGCYIVKVGNVARKIVLT